jgi:hypothetical protein
MHVGRLVTMRSVREAARDLGGMAAFFYLLAAGPATDEAHVRVCMWACGRIRMSVRCLSIADPHAGLCAAASLRAAGAFRAKRLCQPRGAQCSILP